jgi:hypothetical protein
MYLPYTGKGYPMFKESPHFHLNFMNTHGSTMNAHIYNGQGNALGVGGYNSEPAYPSASSNNNNQNDGDVVSGGKNDIGNQNDDDIQYL